MKFKSITVIAVLLLVVASLLVSGCTASSSTSPTPTPTAKPTTPVNAQLPTAKPTTVPKVTPTAKPTATPKPSPKVTDYSSRLDELYGQIYVLTKKFHKTTLNGKEAYEGTGLQTGITLVIHWYPMNSSENAIAFRETLIAKYKAGGWTTYSVETDSWTGDTTWTGQLGSRYVGISSIKYTKIGIPATLEIIGYE